MTKQQDIERGALAIVIVDEVMDTLRTFGLLKDAPDAVLGQALSEAAQKIEPRLPLR